MVVNVTDIEVILVLILLIVVYIKNNHHSPEMSGGYF